MQYTTAIAAVELKRLNKPASWLARKIELKARSHSDLFILHNGNKEVPANFLAGELGIPALNLLS